MTGAGLPVLDRSGRAFGSPLRLHLRPGADPADPGVGTAIGAAWDAVLGEFAMVEAALSTWRPDTELGSLNARAGDPGCADVTPRLRAALAAADRARRVTGGRFDARLFDELDALGAHRAFHYDPIDPPTLPHHDEGRRRAIPIPGRRIDLGGIGKGLALRWALQRAVTVAPGHALLLECGGDMAASAGGLETAPWSVGLEDPAAPAGTPLAVVAVPPGGALATSSVRVRHWTGPAGTAVHHLLDPATRAPARGGLLAVSVLARDPAWAEVWTKALFVAGRDAIAEVARARDLAAWWVRSDGRVGMTPAARLASTWVDEARLGG